MKRKSFIKEFLLQKAQKLVKNSPISLGFLLISLPVTFGARAEDVLFSPYLVQSQPFRIFTSYFLLSRSFSGFFRRFVSILYVQADLESQKESKFSYLFISLLLLIPIQEVLISDFLHFSHFSYSLFPILEESIRWLHGIISEEKSYSFSLFGVVNLDPIHLPFLLLLMDPSLDNLLICLKGFTVALTACYLLKLRRKDGKLCLDFISDTLNSWNSLIQEFLKRNDQD